ncbi:MAG: hypothetical protein K5945_03455 [Bacteroidaceae bacterium]|nr:hypothetical protein [Bacteroidaceae bacterium]
MAHTTASRRRYDSKQGRFPRVGKTKAAGREKNSPPTNLPTGRFNCILTICSFLIFFSFMGEGRGESDRLSYLTSILALPSCLAFDQELEQALAFASYLTSTFLPFMM